MKKKFISVLLAVVLLFSNTLPAFASENQTTSEAGSKEATVLYDMSADYTITIPKKITLNSTKQSEYSVKVEGDIPSSERVYVSPVDAVDKEDGFNFYMQNQNENSTDEDVLATVTQSKVYWNFQDVSDGVEVTDNTVTAEDLKAGKWKGTFTFEINLKSVTSIDVTAKDSDGNDLNASAEAIIGEEKENLLDQLVESGLVDSAEDVDALIDVKSDNFDDLADATFDVSGIANPGDTVIILHYDEIKGEWEYIGEDTVDENGTVSGDFTSFSPVAFVKVTDEGTYEHIHNFDENDECSCGYKMQEIAITYDNREQFGITSDITEYTVPETVEVDGVEYKVTSLENAFRGFTNLKSVELNNNIESINYSFYDCTNLESIIIPSSVTDAQYAFVNCTSLYNVEFEGDQGCYLLGAFENCTSLDNVSLPKASLSMETFKGCTSLSNVTLNNDTVIGTSAFEGCTNLTDINIPDSVQSIGSYAFTSSGLIELEIPDSVMVIDAYAFSNCQNLEYAKLPTFIGGTCGTNLFSGCSNLETVILPERASDGFIGHEWFKDCTSLTTIEIPDYIFGIAYGAFSGCTNLDLTIPDSVQQIDDSSFTDVKHITYNGTATGAPWGALSMN